MKILVGGDYVPRERIACLMQDGNFSYFDEVRQLTKSSDLSILNLEAPIVVNDAVPIDKCGPNLKTTKEVVDSLKYAGFNMVTLANNHIMDYGDSGLQDTIKALKDAGIGQVGVGDNLEAAQIIQYFEKDGERLAIINCCEHEFSIATDNTPGANPLNPIHQYHSILEAKRNADYVLVIVHGGHEHWQLPSPRMVETYRFFIDAGADAIVNHHQHCYSGFESYNGKPIFYGLGNLCFEYSTKKNLPWNFGYMVTIDFSKKGIKYQIHPYEQCSQEPMVKLLDESIFDTDLNRLNDIIYNEKMLKNKTAEYFDESAKSISNILAPFGGRIINAMRRRGILSSKISKSKRLALDNYINCESHRDIMNHWFLNSRQ